MLASLASRHGEQEQWRQYRRLGMTAYPSMLRAPHSRHMQVSPCPMLLLLALFLVATPWGTAAQAPAAAPLAGAAGVVHTPPVGRLQAPLLVLDASSLRYGAASSDPTSDAPGVLASPVECRQLCELVPGCNAYSHCPQAGGCGSGCAAYVADNPPVNATGEIQDPPPNFWVPLPVLSFGPFTSSAANYTSGCQLEATPGTAPGAAPGDAWPYGTCSLYALAGGVAGVVTDTSPDSAGFVSGTLDIPAACGPGAPARACTTCQQVSDPVTCLACYNTTSNDPGSLVFRGQPKERQPQDNCPFCVGVQALERCVACIKNASEPCNACPTSAADQLAPFDMDACLACADVHGAPLVAACTGCAGSANPGSCNICINQTRGNRCDAQGLPDDTPGCIPTTSPVCRTCINAAPNLVNRCLQCTVRPLFTRSCESCAVRPLAAAADAVQCFDCTTTANSTSDVCGSCIDIKDPLQRNLCLSCAKDASMPPASKPFCAGCVNWYSDKEVGVMQRCYSCLATWGQQVAVNASSTSPWPQGCAQLAWEEAMAAGATAGTAVPVGGQPVATTTPLAVSG